MQKTLCSWSWFICINTYLHTIHTYVVRTIGSYCTPSKSLAKRLKEWYKTERSSLLRILILVHLKLVLRQKGLNFGGDQGYETWLTYKVLTHQTCLVVNFCSAIRLEGPRSSFVAFSEMIICFQLNNCGGSHVGWIEFVLAQILRWLLSAVSKTLLATKYLCKIYLRYHIDDD